MNSYKLAYKNMKKSFQDYVVYFFTLILGVAIYYVFNAVKDQSIMEGLAASGNATIQMLVFFLDSISVIVAFVLGFLIIYANNFLIRRRKKEFGIYLLLGMEKKDVSKILVSETLIVGLISLASGIGSGVFVSQFVSIGVGKFFDADMSAYVFSVSFGAIVKTIINFAIVYAVVLLFHSATLSKLKLVDLFSAAKKTEKQVLRNPIASTIMFVLSAGALAAAYHKVGYCSSELYRKDFVCCIFIGIVATMLLFWSMAGFLMIMLKKIKPFYFRNLNCFVIRQFCNSVNSSSVSMGIICLMIFVTICTFSTGFAAAHQFQENTRNLTPADFSIQYTADETVSQCLEREGMEEIKLWSGDYCEVPIYHSESVTIASTIGSILDKAKEQFPYAKWNTPEDMIRLSDYNRLAQLYHMPTYELEEDEYILMCDFAMLRDVMNTNLEQGGTQIIGEMELKPAYSQCQDGYLYMSGTNMNLGVVILPDAVVDQLAEHIQVAGYVLAGNYSAKDKEEKKEIDTCLLEATKSYTAFRYMNENPIPPMMIGTKINIRESNNGLTMMASFIVIYIGVIFLIASAALLALKALTESIDGVEKFRILKKIGCEERMLRKSLFAQIGVYFILPLVVACIHSFFGLKYIRSELHSIIGTGFEWGISASAVLLILLYGGYMIATYKNSKRIVEID